MHCAYGRCATLIQKTEEARSQLRSSAAREKQIRSRSKEWNRNWPDFRDFAILVFTQGVFTMGRITT
jgi:hypothetical protein